MNTLMTLKSIALRSHQTLVQDMAGAAALVVMLLVGLYLPSII